MPFKRPNDTIDVDLMLNAGKFKHVYSVENGFQMLSLPYNDSLTSLYILKPHRPENTSITEILQRLDYLTLNKFIDQMTMKATVLRFPKFDLRATSRLEDALKAIGVQSIFLPSVANFALMIDGKEINNTNPQVLSRFNVDEELPEESKRVRDLISSLPNPGVHVDSILHDVKLTINEYGTEAVAATSGILARSAILFYVDSPFYIFIRNEKTKLVTFSAIINDPTS